LTDPKYVCFALETANKSELVRRNSNEQMKQISNKCKDSEGRNDARVQKVAAGAIEKIMNGVFFPIFK